MKGISGSTRRLVERLPRETVANILRRHYGEFAPWLPKAERPRLSRQGGGKSEH